jgi:hypothetical protein
VLVTADDIARAMQEDHFFSDYDQDTLLVRGTVGSVTRQNNDLLVELDTSIETYVLCDLGTASPKLQAGDTITVTARGADAQRASSAVLLMNCHIP